MELKDTVKLMLSADFKERFQAEYAQDKNRAEGLERMLKLIKQEHYHLSLNAVMSFYMNN